MSKPLIVSEIVSPAIHIHTTDNSGSVVLDQADASSNIITIQTSGITKNILLTNDPAVEVKLIGGNVIMTFPNGNLQASGSQIFLFGSQVFQTMLTVGNSDFLDPANAVYNELNNTDIPTLPILSRVNINPAAGGTTINSLIIQSGQPNVDGREIWIQNIGTVAAQTITLNNLSPSGTVGGQFRAPAAAFVIEAGGGASIMFDEDLNVWPVRAHV